jgi:hypothetical protein
MARATSSRLTPAKISASLCEPMVRKQQLPGAHGNPFGKIYVPKFQDE